MKSLVKFAGVVGVLIACTQMTRAVPITGAIGFTGAVTFNTSSAATATQVTSWLSPTTVTLASGAFSTIPTGSVATFSPAVWNLNTILAINNFWSVNGFTFKLVSSSITAQGGVPGINGFVVVNGTGIVSGPANSGYDPTTLSWSFTSQDPSINGPSGPHWTFSASANSVQVPDGGATVLLFGLGLVSLTLLKKRFTAEPLS